MELSKNCLTYWNFAPAFNDAQPFDRTLDKVDSIYVWECFDTVTRRICRAVKRREFLVVAGTACSAKTTAWQTAHEKLKENYSNWHLAKPRGLDVSKYSDINLGRCIAAAIDPMANIKRDREARGIQIRNMLENANADNRPVVLLINDAHLCNKNFLLLCKQIWDDMDGFDRLLSVILIGQPRLLQVIRDIHEISERTEVVRMTGLENKLVDYVRHEFNRFGVSDDKIPLDESAFTELKKLSSRNWTAARDHPLIINNIVSRALTIAWKIKEKTITGEIIAEAMRKEDSF
jgi:type II secretory pathway predicted ATPase ExeA